MNRSLCFFILVIFTTLGCQKNAGNPPTPPAGPPPVIQPTIVLNEYDATYTSNSGIFYTYSYHVKDTLYYSEGQSHYWWGTLIRNAHDTLYHASGQMDSLFGVNKGCVALISSIPPSQQGNYNYYIGSYYKFSLFNDTTVGNIQFMIPTDNFPSVDSIPVGVAFLNFYGGLNSFYTNMAKAEVKVTSNQDFVKLGDSFSYANPLIPAQGTIDSAEVHILVTRFSDNGIHPNSRITKTMDANYLLTFYFHDGSYFNLINGKFTNLFFQKAPM